MVSKQRSSSLLEPEPQAIEYFFVSEPTAMLGRFVALAYLCCERFDVSEIAVQGFLHELVRGAVNLGGEMLESLFEVGSELDGHGLRVCRLRTGVNTFLHERWLRPKAQIIK